MKLGMFCSNRCPGDLILTAYDWARAVRRRSDLTIVSGFHTVIEKDVLEILLAGTCPIVVVPARSVASMRIPAAWKPHLATDRLRIESPFPASARRITKRNALLRNEYVAGMVDEILIIHASADGHLEQQCVGWLREGKKVSALSGEQNQRLWEMGVEVWDVL
ncbi:MAG: hypothetical protein K8R77_03940 [Anaerolineaceae bacterium]|nr:hypothetical protein [Anaerolineaceae bacterium]